MKRSNMWIGILLQAVNVKLKLTTSTLLERSIRNLNEIKENFLRWQCSLKDFFIKNQDVFLSVFSNDSLKLLQMEAILHTTKRSQNFRRKRLLMVYSQLRRWQKFKDVKNQKCKYYLCLKFFRFKFLYNSRTYEFKTENK